jgi:rhodanese-related sulfurtransferase
MKAGRPALAACALIAGLAAALTPDVPTVGALELAEWIREQRPDVRVIDLRLGSPTEHKEWEHVPTSDRHTLATLASVAWPTTDTIVIYGSSTIDAERASRLLGGRGYRRVFVLHGGLAAWNAEVINPTLAESPSAEEIAAFERASALSRYFGGAPRVRGRVPAPPSYERRGC